MGTPIQPEALAHLEQCDESLNSAADALLAMRASMMTAPLSPESRAAARVTLARVLASIRQVESRRTALLGAMALAERA